MAYKGFVKLSTKLLAKHLLIPSILLQEGVYKYQPSHTLGHSFMDPYISVFFAIHSIIYLEYSMNFFEDEKITVISQAQYDPNAWYVFKEECTPHTKSS